MSMTLRRPCRPRCAPQLRYRPTSRPGPARLDTRPPRWDDAAQGGTADGAPWESPEPPGVRAGRGRARAGGGVWVAAVSGRDAGEEQAYWMGNTRVTLSHRLLTPVTCPS